MGHDISIAPYLFIPPKFPNASTPQSLQCAAGVPSIKEGHVDSKFAFTQGTFFLYPPLNADTSISFHRILDFGPSIVVIPTFRSCFFPFLHFLHR